MLSTLCSTTASKLPFFLLQSSPRLSDATEQRKGRVFEHIGLACGVLLYTGSKVEGNHFVYRLKSPGINTHPYMYF
jgi:hypothetical protein